MSIRLPKTKWTPNALPIYIGYDSKESKMFDMCVYSLRKNSSCDLDIYKLDRQRLKTLGFYNRQEAAGGQSTEFAYSRFLVPFLQNFRGYALFMDCDMIACGDIREVFLLADDTKAISVVKHPSYTPKFSIKMDGAKQEAYPRKNWSSFMLWNSEHKCNRGLIPNFIDRQLGSYLHRFEWIDDKEIGSIPNTWNYLCDEGWGWSTTPKNIHYTNFHDEVDINKVNPNFEWKSIYDDYAKRVDSLSKPDKRELLFTREINL